VSDYSRDETERSGPRDVFGFSIPILSSLQKKTALNLSGQLEAQGATPEQLANFQVAASKGPTPTDIAKGLGTSVAIVAPLAAPVLAPVLAPVAAASLLEGRKVLGGASTALKQVDVSGIKSAASTVASGAAAVGVKTPSIPPVKLSVGAVLAPPAVLAGKVQPVSGGTLQSGSLLSTILQAAGQAGAPVSATVLPGQSGYAPLPIRGATVAVAPVAPKVAIAPVKPPPPTDDQVLAALKKNAPIAYDAIMKQRAQKALDAANADLAAHGVKAVPAAAPPQTAQQRLMASIARMAPIAAAQIQLAQAQKVLAAAGVKPAARLRWTVLSSGQIFRDTPPPTGAGRQWQVFDDGSVKQVG
jgi:hypothetical protein